MTQPPGNAAQQPPAMMLETEPLSQLADAPPAAAECSVRVVLDFDSFLLLEPVWNALVEEAGVGHPFLRHEWVRTWWE